MAITLAGYARASSVLERHEVMTLVGFTLVGGSCNFAIMQLAPVLASRMELHHTFGSMERSCCTKMACFQVVNTVASALAFYLFTAQTGQSWYHFGPPFILGVMLCDTIIQSIGFDLLQPEIMFNRLWLAPKAHTQREMNQLFDASVEIYLARRLQLVIKFIALCLIFAPAMPICYLVTACFMWLSIWIGAWCQEPGLAVPLRSTFSPQTPSCALPCADRFNLLRRIAPPPRSPDSLISMVLEAILPSLILLHLASVVLFYSSKWVLLQARPLCARLSGQAQNCGVRQDAAAPACTTPAALTEATAAIGIAWASLLLSGSLLLFYWHRERRRMRGATAHVVGDEFARYLDHLTVSGHSVQDQVLKEPRMSDFRGQPGLTTYTPPIPASVYREMNRRASVASGSV